MNWRGLRTVVLRECWRFAKIGLGTVFAPILTAVLYFIVFRLSLGEVIPKVGNLNFMTFLAPGLIIMAMIQNAFANNTASLMIAKYRGTITDFLMAPLTPVELTSGLFSGGVARGCSIGVVGVIVFSFIIDIPYHSMGYLIAFSVLGCMMMALAGTICALIFETFDAVANISNFFITPMIFLSGTFYSIKTLPDVLQPWAFVNPFFYLIDGFRYGLVGHTDGDPMLGIAVLSGVVIVLYSIAWLIVKTGYKTRS